MAVTILKLLPIPLTQLIFCGSMCNVGQTPHRNWTIIAQDKYSWIREGRKTVGIHAKAERYTYRYFWSVLEVGRPELQAEREQTLNSHYMSFSFYPKRLPISAFGIYEGPVGVQHLAQRHFSMQMGKTGVTTALPLIHSPPNTEEFLSILTEHICYLFTIRRTEPVCTFSLRS